MHRVGFVLFGGFQVMSAAAVAVFETANIIGQRQFYDVHVVSETGGAIRSSAGVVFDSEPLSTTFDTLLVAAGTVIQPTPKSILAMLRDAAASSRDQLR